MWTIGGVTFNYISTSNTICMGDDLSSFVVLHVSDKIKPNILLQFCLWSGFSSSAANARGRVMMWRWLFNKWTMHKESTVDHYFNRTTHGLNSNLSSQSTQPASPSSDLLTNSEYLNRLKSFSLSPWLPPVLSEWISKYVWWEGVCWSSQLLTAG